MCIISLPMHAKFGGGRVSVVAAVCVSNTVLKRQVYYTHIIYDYTNNSLPSCDYTYT